MSCSSTTAVRPTEPKIFSAIARCFGPAPGPAQPLDHRFPHLAHSDDAEFHSTLLDSGSRLAVPVHDPAQARQLTQSDGATDVQLLGADPELAAQAQLEPVGEPGRSIPINGGG